MTAKVVSTPKKQAQPSRLTRAAQLIARLVVIGLLCWMGLSTGGALSMLFSGESVRHEQSDARSDFPELPQVTAEMLRGRWEFAGMPAGVELQQTDDAGVEAALCQPPAENDVSLQLGGSGAQLLGMLQARLNKLNESADLEIYGADEESFRVRVFVGRVRGTADFLGGNVAVPRGDGGWMVVKVRGLPQSAVVDSTPASLVPVATGSKRLASRRAADGRLQCEVVELGKPFAETVTIWQANGWKLEQTPDGAADARTFHLTQDEEIVQVHLLVEANETPKYLLFVRGPLAAD